MASFILHPVYQLPVRPMFPYYGFITNRIPTLPPPSLIPPPPPPITTTTVSTTLLPSTTPAPVTLVTFPPQPIEINPATPKLPDAFTDNSPPPLVFPRPAISITEEVQPTINSSPDITSAIIQTNIATQQNISTTIVETSGNFTIDYMFSAVNATRVPSYTGNPSSQSDSFIPRLCGHLGYCSEGIYDVCSNEPIDECEICDVGQAATFLFLVVCLGLLIVLGNILILLVGYKRHKARNSDKMDFCKNSLALADMLTGIQILTVVVYNFSWSIHATPEELDQFENESRSSAGAFFGGALYLFGFTSSVYHLCFMSGLRLFAVVFPLKFKFMGKRNVVYILIGVWIFSAVASTSPGWFPEQLFFAFQVSLLLFFPTLNSLADTDVALGVLAIFYIAPYALMTIFAIATAIVIRYRQYRKLKLLANPSALTKQLAAKEELSILATIIIMQVALTIAIIPTLTVVGLFYNGVLDCSNITIPYIVSAYFGTTNSLVNVFIYNIREKKFRESTKKILCWCKSDCLSRDSATTTSNSLQTQKPGNSTSGNAQETTGKVSIISV